MTIVSFLHLVDANAVLQDINNSGDGGIYAELIRNRAFQYSPSYPVSLAAWHAINGAILSLNRNGTALSEALPISMKVVASASAGDTGFYNDGYWGMDVKKQKYTGSFWVRGAYAGSFKAALQSQITSDVFGTVDIPSKAKSGEWVEHEFELVPTKDAPNSNNTFAITFNPSVCPKQGALIEASAAC
jgi:alpha-L-arabinofuranosidase